MQSSVVFDDKSLVKYLNQFLSENNLVFFYEINHRKDRILRSQIDMETLKKKRDFIIHIGERQIFEEKILKITRPLTKEDKVDFIYMYHDNYPDEIKITDTVFIWSTSSPAAKTNGNLLTKFFKLNLNIGMKAADSLHSSLDKALKKFYWPKEILSCAEKLYNNGGVVQIEPIR